MAFTCPECNRTSHHPKDEEHQYCGACHKFFGPGDIQWAKCERCHGLYEIQGSMKKQDNGNYRCIYCHGLNRGGVVATR